MVPKPKTPKEQTMEFTGERFIPNHSPDVELEIEHFHRYRVITGIVKDKIVLDAASGEGYGSLIMSEVAGMVYGVDISTEAVQHAQQTYKRENLRFLQGAVASLPLPDHAIDVVISFETIEHVDEQTQTHFLQEINRVLKEDGLLVISTPNKEIYSDMPNYQNEYHVKEFYQEEFKQFLRNYFRHVEFYYQGFEVSSLIDNGSTSRLSRVDFSRELIFQEPFLHEYYLDEPLWHEAGPQEPGEDHHLSEHSKEELDGKYLIAVCTNSLAKPVFSLGSIMRNTGKYSSLRQRIVELQNDLEERNWHLRNLNDFIAEKDKFLAAQNTRIEELAVWGKALDQELREKNAMVTANNEQIEELSNWVNALVAEIKQKEQLLNGKNTLPQELAVGKILAGIAGNPKVFVRHLNTGNFKKLIHYLRNESWGEIGVRLVNYLNKYKPAEKRELQIFPEKRVFPKLVFSAVSEPVVSIVIPVYNQWPYTYACLEAILANTEGVDYEVVIADDASSDETETISCYTENARVIRNTDNLGFLKNCNQAAAQAKGKYIHFLNNDTNVQNNWLKPLVDLLENDEKVGMTGSKLVYADGRLQEAGGIIWSDAGGWNYGRLDDPDKPEYNYVKEVDYISGASLMIRAQLWREIGGFDDRYAPAYCEDSDLAFEVRKRGYHVLFQPKSVVVHLEGVSHGTDQEQGIKRYQAANVEKFREKWGEVLGKEHLPNGTNVFCARDRSRNKKIILVIDHYVPHYDKDAGSRTTFNYLKLFVQMGFNVKFLGDNFFRHEPYTSELEQHGIEVLYGLWYKDNYEKWLKENSARIDYVYLNRPHISIKYIDLIKKYTKAKIIYYGHDLHYLREFREYELSKDKAVLKSAQKWNRMEFDVMKKSDVVYYPSPTEVEEIKKHHPEINAKAIPAYIYENFNLYHLKPSEQRKDLLFVGGFRHKPNIDAVLWFAHEIFPQVLARIPDLRLYVVGSNPPDGIKALQSPNLIVTGFITDQELADYYHNCRLAVVPLRYGAGVKGKVVEAMYHQIPVVTTSIGAEGLADIEELLIVADEREEFAHKVETYYKDVLTLKKISVQSRTYVKEHFAQQSALKVIGADIQP